MTWAYVDFTDSSIGLPGISTDYSLCSELDEQSIQTLSKAVTHQSNLEYCLGDVGVLSSESIRLLLRLHPVMVIADGQRYYPVAGFRTLQIARFLLPESSAIQVREVTHWTNAHIQVLAQADLYLTPVVFSLRQPSAAMQLAELWSAIGRQFIKRYTPSLSNRKSFSGALGFGRRVFDRGTK